MEDQEAADLGLKHLGSGPGGSSVDPHFLSKAKTAAQILVDTSLQKGSSDNVTALVVFL